MAYRVRYEGDRAPRVGAFFNAIEVFSLSAKEEAESRFRELFADFKSEGVISEDSILKQKRIFGPDEAQEIAKEFGEKRVDVIIIVNSAFPNGHVFSTVAADPYLTKIPLIVTADREYTGNGEKEWTANSWCGVIMNNHVAKQLGRYIRTLPGSPQDESYRDELKLLLNVYHTVREMRSDYLGRFGDAPGGFHSASINELSLTAMFGTCMSTVDLLAVMHTYKTGKAKGLRGEVSFSEEDVKETEGRIRQGRICLVGDDMVRAGARLYHALRAIIEANGFTSAALKCWPEFQSEIFPYTPCLVIGQLLADRVVTAASCESDIPCAITQSLGTLLSGEPAAVVDFVNVTRFNEVVELGHCGCGIPGLMVPNDPSLLQQVAEMGGRVDEQLREKVEKGEIPVCDVIGFSSPCRLAGFKTGPNLIGQFRYGKKTGIDLLQEQNGKYKMLVFTGESSQQTAKNMLRVASDVRVDNYKKLHELIITHGFSHHLALVMDDIAQELKIICEYYGIEYISPDD